MLIDLLARRWGSAAGGRDGMSIAASFLAWTLAELGHRVRAHHQASDAPPWQRAGVEWVACPVVETPADWTADLVLTTIAPSWPRLVAAAQQAQSLGRLVYWHHHGPTPYGHGATLARCAATGDRELGWSRSVTLPPSTWAAEQGGTRTGSRVVVPGATRAKGAQVALQVARALPDVPFLLLPGRACEADLRPWRELPHVRIGAPEMAPEAWLAEARVLLSPSRVETYGLAMIEAAVRGVPVVSSDLPGPRVALDDSATYLPVGAPVARWVDATRAALEQEPRPLVLPSYASVVSSVLVALRGPAPAKAPAVHVAKAVAPARPPAAPPPRPVAPVPPPVQPPAVRRWPIGGRLHVGCGPKRIAGWLNTDGVVGKGPDGVVDLHDPQLPPSTFRVIYGCHVLEHCWPQDTPRILAALRAALLPGGTLRLSVPDLRLVVRHCVDAEVFGGETSALSVLYGGAYSRETPAPDLHRQVFWAERLTRLLTEAGLVNVRSWGPGQYPEIDAVRDWATWPRGEDGRSTISLNLEADRPGELPGSRQIDVSVLLGTVNRPVMLQECIASVRASLAGSGLRHEVVVAYGAEDEPALDWMREQPDVRPVLGGMAGAIEAFNEAYRASRGRMVCQLNDDVLVDGDSITRSVRHLDADPTCAGVVFAFDRGDGRGYRNERLGGKLHPNQVVARRETCEAVVERIGAFWGDTEHRTDKTYGGDSAFGALCHHLGMRLDALEGVTCRDRCGEPGADDELRARNKAVDPGHSVRWRETYLPLLQGPAVAPGPDEWPAIYLPRPGMQPRRSPVEAGPQERLLHLCGRTASEDLAAHREAFAAIGETVELPWTQLNGSLARQVLEAAEQHQPTLVWCQIQREGFDLELLRELRRRVPSNCLILNWSGDVRRGATAPPLEWQVELGGLLDLSLDSDTTEPRRLRAAGVRGTGYLQCGYCDRTFVPGPTTALLDRRAVLTASNYEWLDGGARAAIVRRVGELAPGLLRVQGPHWSAATLPGVEVGLSLSRDVCATLYRSAPLVVSQSCFDGGPDALGRYTSDRLLRIMGCGGVAAVRRFPDQEGLGLRDGVNCLCWDSPEDLAALLRDWVRPERDADRLPIRTAAAETARTHWTWPVVAEQLLAIVRTERTKRGPAWSVG